MKWLEVCKDGGPESTVTSYILVEIKPLFSIMLLRFDNGSRDAYHEHAFNCVSWVLSGGLYEEMYSKAAPDGLAGVYYHRPRFWPVVTLRSTFHKVTSIGTSWVLTFRGPWADKWREWLPAQGRFATLTHGRKEVQS